MNFSNPFKVPELTRTRAELDELTSRTDTSIGLFVAGAIGTLESMYKTQLQRDNQNRLNIPGLRPVVLPRYGLIARNVQIVPGYYAIDKGAIELSLDALGATDTAENFTLRLDSHGSVHSTVGDKEQWYPTPAEGNKSALICGYAESNLERLDLTELADGALVGFCGVQFDLSDIRSRQQEWAQRTGEFQTVYQPTTSDITARLPLEVPLHAAA